MGSSLNYYELYDKLRCNFVLGENIGNYLRSHLLRASRLPEKQPITGRYLHICRTTTRARVLHTNRSLFPFDTNDVTRNLNCSRRRRRHVAHYIRGQSSHERLYASGNPKFSFLKPLNLYETATKTTWK